MTWQHGQPVRTQQDVTEWQAWKRDNKLAAQRQRRARLRRIDYYPSAEAGAVIDSLTNHKQIDGVYSSVIDRLILEAVFGITSVPKSG